MKLSFQRYYGQIRPEPCTALAFLVATRARVASHAGRGALLSRPWSTHHQSELVRPWQRWNQGQWWMERPAVGEGDSDRPWREDDFGTPTRCVWGGEEEEEGSSWAASLLWLVMFVRSAENLSICSFSAIFSAVFELFITIHCSWFHPGYLLLRISSNVNLTSKGLITWILFSHPAVKACAWNKLHVLPYWP